jgi:hypothetical protein
LSENKTIIVIPAVNINGTSRAELVEQQLTARHALDAAMLAMKAAAPHGRDYQTVDQSVFRIARAEHGRRLQAIVALMSEYQQMAEAINAQGSK